MNIPIIFAVVINVRNPYFDEIRFRLNSSDVTVEGGSKQNTAPVRAGRAPSSNTGGRFDPTQDMEYRKYKKMGEEIVEVLQQVRQQAREEKVTAKAPKVAVMCPHCGAQTTLNASKCCEYCGGVVEG